MSAAEFWKQRAEDAEAQVASAESMMEAYRTEAHEMTDRAEAAEEQRDTLDSEVTRLWEALFWVSEWPNRHVGALTERDNDAVILSEYARAALARVAPPEEET